MDRIKQNFRLRSGRSTQVKRNTLNGGVKIIGPVEHTSLDEFSRPVPSKSDEDAADIESFGPPGSVRGKSSNFPTMPDGKYSRKSTSFPFNSNAPLPPLPVNDRGRNDSPLKPVSETSTTVRRRKHSAPASRLPTAPLPHIADLGESSGDDKTFDLKPPPLRAHPAPMENLSEMLFSVEHLEIILQDPKLFLRFTAFLNAYRPHSAPVLVRYLETAKAMKAIQYANAIAAGLSSIEEERVSRVPWIAATVDSEFEKKSKRCFEILHTESLPAFITYKLVRLATDLLIREMTGAQTPLLRDLVEGLSEIFCITDPNLPDNPIIFASAEFYRMTGYERDFVIGRNCRFLQGHQRTQPSVIRIRNALKEGQEISDILLNFRKDGTPFLNCLNVAPLLDDKGEVKYFIGAQVDVSGLVEEGKGLDSFERLLKHQRIRSSLKKGIIAQDDLYPDQEESSINELLHHNPLALERLKELSEMFDLEESAVVQTHSRSNSINKDNEDPMYTFHEDRTGTSSSNIPRRVLNDHSLRHMTSEGDLSHTSTTKNHNDVTQGFSTLSPSSQSGQLPGIYQSYFLIRPAPSLRIVFVSPSLHYLGKNLLQSRLLSHISAPDSTITELKEAFIAGVPVTAKVVWRKEKDTPESEGETDGHTKWLKATPVFGSNDTIGVWMIIIVDRHIWRHARDSTDRSVSVPGSVSRVRHSQSDHSTNGIQRRASGAAVSSTGGNARAYSLDRQTAKTKRPTTSTSRRKDTPLSLPIITDNTDDPTATKTHPTVPPTSWRSPLRQHPPHRVSSPRQQGPDSNVGQSSIDTTDITALPSCNTPREPPNNNSSHPNPDGHHSIHTHPEPISSEIPPPYQATTTTTSSLTRENLEAATTIAATPSTSASNPYSPRHHPQHHQQQQQQQHHHHHHQPNPRSHHGHDSISTDDYCEEPPEPQSPAHTNPNKKADTNGKEDRNEEAEGEEEEEQVIRHVTRKERMKLLRIGSARERLVIGVGD